MKGTNWIDRFLQNTRKPEGFFGRIILRGMNCGHAPMARWGLGCMEWRPSWHVLDIGCGGGANLARLADLCPEGKIYGIDFSEESVAFARRKNARDAETRIFVRQGDAAQLPYASRAFDAVTAFETVYFWGDLRRAFAEVARVLREGGYFLICNEASDPSNGMWTSRIEGMRVYSAEQLAGLLAETGFTNITVQRRNKEQICVIARKKGNETVE